MNDEQLEAKTIETYDAHADVWATSHAVRNDWEWAAKRFRAFLPSGKVLEVGCGGHRDADELIGLGYDYLGTDASEGMIRTARGGNPKAEFKQLNVYDLPELNQVFDGFWACAVLLHIPRERIDEALQSIGKVVRKDGIGMISMKNGDRTDFEVRDKHGRHEERLFVYWKREEFAEVLTRNGFEVIDYVYKPLSERTSWHVFFVRKV
jgi:SAM-dependent methyltransferase